MKKLKIGIIDLLEKEPVDNWIQTNVLNPNFISIMPQVIGVWCEKLGHEVYYDTYTGKEDLFNLLPDGINVLFISSFTQSAFLAYALSNYYRKKGVVTVIGGPHARSYPEDCQLNFDYIIQLTDQNQIEELLKDHQPNPKEGKILTNDKQPSTIPGILERKRFFDISQSKSKYLHLIPIIASMGCPFSCDYCIDGQVTYIQLPYEQLREDLQTIVKYYPKYFVFWQDPNFGFHFEQYMSIIKEVTHKKKLRFGAESSLSLLKEDNLKVLRENGFLALLPGIESWFAYDNKLNKGKNTIGKEKLELISNHVKLVSQYIPYLQINFIFGLDADGGKEPFELTKKFFDMNPVAFPGINLLTSFGNNAILRNELVRDNRIIDMPYMYQDNSFTNVVLKNYHPIEFYENLVDLSEYIFSKNMMWRRINASRVLAGKLVNLGRALTEGKNRTRKFRTILNMIKEDEKVLQFYLGNIKQMPKIFNERIKVRLRHYYNYLPAYITGNSQ